MVAQLGRATVFKLGAVTASSTLTGVREISVEMSGEPINVTSNEDAGVQTLLADVVAEQLFNLSVSGVTKDSVIKDLWIAGTRSVVVEVVYPDTYVLGGTFNITSYSEGHPYQDAVTFEASLTSNGAVTYAIPV